MDDKSNKKKSIWLIFALIVCGIQLIASLMAAYMLIRVNMLPNLYLWGILAVLLLLWLLTFGMLYLIDRKKQEQGIEKGYVLRRGLGTVIAAIVIAACLFGISLLDTFMATVNAITRINNVETVEINIYVLKNDPAETIEDAADYVFGICTAYDYEDSLATAEELEKLYGKEIQIVEYEDVFEMIDALYDGSCQAIILNGAYVSIIEEIDGYETFYDKTRVLHYIEVEKEVAPAKTETKVPGKQETAGEEEAAEETAEEVWPETNGFIIYCSGSDTRNTKLTRGNSDVNILIVVNPDTHKILMVSTPRDYYIDISIAPGNMDKLTHCGVYGPQCSMDTLGSLYGVPIDYYAQINFTGFEKLINSIGGVNVYSDATFKVGSYSYQKGSNYMDGAKALVFARDRHSFADGDRARGRHQMAVISAIVDKLTGSTALITSYSDIMDSLSGMFKTNFPQEMMSELVKNQISDMQGWDIETYSVSGSDSSAYCYSLRNMKTYVMIPYEDQVSTATEMMKEVLYPEN